jgi:acyl carrier protein
LKQKNAKLNTRFQTHLPLEEICQAFSLKTLINKLTQTTMDQQLDLIKKEIKEIIIEVLRLDLKPEDIKDDASFFGTETEPGIIEDSLVILEIATLISEKYDIPPTEFSEDTFINVNSLAELAIKFVNA